METLNKFFNSPLHSPVLDVTSLTVIEAIIAAGLSLLLVACGFTLIWLLGMFMEALSTVILNALEIIGEELTKAARKFYRWAWHVRYGFIKPWRLKK